MAVIHNQLGILQLLVDVRSDLNIQNLVSCTVEVNKHVYVNYDKITNLSVIFIARYDKGKLQWNELI